MEEYHDKIVDVHVHAGIRGDGVFRGMGSLSTTYCSQIGYKIFLLFAKMNAEDVSDTTLHEKLLETIAGSGLYGAVCLAVDHVYERNGTPRPDLSDVWVGNDYIRKLREDNGSGIPKIFFGCSVHPYDPRFEYKVQQCIDDGAVLIKWIPSAMQFDVADTLVRDRLIYLATARNGKPLPLLLHTAGEYAIPTSNPMTQSWDYYSWSWLDNRLNSWPFKKRWHTPKVPEIRKNIDASLEAGAVIIFAHCGLPYFTWKLFRFMEHSDFTFVKDMVTMNFENRYPGACYADLSALCTPFRKSFFDDVKTIPDEYLLYGSDFPTPAFEIGADRNENIKDFNAFLQGDVARLFIPQDNLMTVNLREMKNVFGESKAYTNFARVFL